MEFVIETAAYGVLVSEIPRRTETDAEYKTAVGNVTVAYVAEEKVAEVVGRLLVRPVH